MAAELDPQVCALLPALEPQAPGISSGHRRILAGGLENQAVAIGERWVLRWRRGSGNNDLAVEARLLGALRGHTTTPIPEPVALHQEDGIAVLVYPMLRGATMPVPLAGAARERAVRDLARFLAELHGSISADEAAALGVPEAAPVADAIIAAGLGELSDPALHDLVRRSQALELEGEPGDRVLLHNDLHQNNTVWTGDRVAGVLDFGDARTGDVHRDFAALCQQDPQLSREVAAAYAALTGRTLSWKRIVAHAVMRSIFDLATLPAAGVPEKLRRLRIQTLPALLVAAQELTFPDAALS